MAFLGLAASCVLIAFTASGAPETSPNIRWEAPASCPNARHVQAAIDAMVGAPSAGNGVSDLVARATVREAPGGGFTLWMQIETKGAAEAKVLNAETCATLADAYAVIVAFTIDPSAGAHVPPAETAKPLSTTPTPTARWATPPTASATPGTRAVVGPWVAMGAGLLPFPAYGLGARIAVEHGLRWEFAGVYWPEQPSSVALGSTPIVGARVQLGSVQPSVCIPLEREALALCAGGEVGAMRAVGTGVSQPGSGTSWWLAIDAGLAARVALGPIVDVRFRLDVGVPFLRPTFILQNVGLALDSVTAYQPAFLFAVLSFQPDIQFFSTVPARERHVNQ